MKFKSYLYGAYGSNLNMHQMKYRCPSAQPVGKLELKGWQLVFRSVADIQHKKDASVPIGLWLITDKCEQALDRYEGYPTLYTKQTIRVPKLKKEFDTDRVMIYTMRDRYTVIPPNTQYLSSITQGYGDFGIDVQPLTEAVGNSYLEERYEPKPKLRLL